MPTSISRAGIRRKAGTTGITSAGQGVITAADYAAIRTLLSLVPGTNVLAPNGSGSALTALHASEITTGTISEARLQSGSIANPVRVELAADDSWAGANGVYSTILTIAIPSTGRWHIAYRLICNTLTSLSFSARVAEGTGAFGDPNGSVVGTNYGNATPSNAVVSTGSPNIVAGSSRTSNLWAVSEGDVIINVTTPGTFLLQRTYNTGVAGQIVKAGGYIEAHKQ